MFFNIFGKVKLLLLGSAAFVIAIFAAYFKGKEETKSKLQAEANEDRLKNIKKKEQIRNEIQHDVDLANRARKWLREDNQNQ